MLTPSAKPAMLLYEPSSFRIISPGNHVICAVSGQQIPLEALRYWSVLHQEAYASCELATRRLTGH